MKEYQLPIEQAPATLEALSRRGLADAAITQNASWFVTLRWFVVSVFVVFGVAGSTFRAVLESNGVLIPYWWLWALATVLLIANIPLYLITRKLDSDSTRRSVMRNLWTQITLDLLVVTVLVYNIGTVETFAAFTYLFHIVLACIFFPPRQSLLVTCVAAVFYLVLVVLEATAALPPRGILIYPGGRFSATPLVEVSLALFGVLIWFIVWYITSTLSKTVRRRDQQLSIANDQLMVADAEKNRQMLITTHDLKAPFAGIESNIQVLKYQYWDEIPESVHGIIERIDNRAHMLRDRINAILVLGNLKSKPPGQSAAEAVELPRLINEIAATLREKADSRGITLQIDMASESILSDPQQLSMLFSNLIANAISYSRDRGRVQISSSSDDDAVSVSIKDEGIGIRDDALSEIFDEYFRTKEATKFNRQSTGLGLAIVKVIAQKLKLGVRVQSELEKGTTFTVIIPRHAATNLGGTHGKNTDNR
jgi:two-component system, OmpR family, phosphate regulon sensor histidine kinase PhoR